MDKEYLLEHEYGKFKLWKGGETFFELEIKKTEKNYNKIVDLLDFLEIDFIDMINAYDYDKNWEQDE